jgi:hypothetical protein
MIVSGTLAASADEASDAKALVDRAIKAQGGEEKLAKVTAFTADIKGTFHGMGAATPYTGELATSGRGKHKVVIESEAMGKKFRFVSVLNVDKGWIKVNDDTMALEKDALASAQHDAYAEWVTTLVPLKDRMFTLATVGEIKIDRRPALGIRVVCKGQRDLNLYFDKETGFLVKCEGNKIDESGKEVNEESLFDEYKEVQGVKIASRFRVKRDGKLFVEGEAINYQLSDKLDDSVFAKP